MVDKYIYQNLTKSDICSDLQSISFLWCCWYNWDFANLGFVRIFAWIKNRIPHDSGTIASYYSWWIITGAMAKTRELTSQCMQADKLGGGAGTSLLQSLQISPTKAGVVLYIVVTWRAWPIWETNAYKTIAATDSFIVADRDDKALKFACRGLEARMFRGRVITW